LTVDDDDGTRTREGPGWEPNTKGGDRAAQEPGHTVVPQGLGAQAATDGQSVPKAARGEAHKIQLGKAAQAPRSPASGGTHKLASARSKSPPLMIVPLLVLLMVALLVLGYWHASTGRLGERKPAGPPVNRPAPSATVSPAAGAQTKATAGTTSGSLKGRDQAGDDLAWPAARQTAVGTVRTEPKPSQRRFEPNETGTGSAVEKPRAVQAPSQASMIDTSTPVLNSGPSRHQEQEKAVLGRDRSAVHKPRRPQAGADRLTPTERLSGGDRAQERAAQQTVEPPQQRASETDPLGLWYRFKDHERD